MTHNIYTSVRPLHLLSKFSGFSLYSIDRKTFEVKFRKLDALFATIHSILTVVLNIMFWKTYSMLDVHNSEVVNKIFPVFAYCNYVASTLAKIWSFCHRHEYAQLLKTFHSIDIDFEHFDIKFDYSNRRKTIKKTIIATIFVETLTGGFTHLTQHHYNMNISWNNLVFTLYGFYANMIVMNQFMMSISEVKLRLKAVNDVLR